MRTINTVDHTPLTLSNVEAIVAELKAGRMVVVVDDEDRENEGDLLMAAEAVTPEAINFMAKYGRGLICLTLNEERCDYLGLPMMAVNNGTSFGTNFTVSIEAAEGVTTGISAYDRAKTIQVAVSNTSKPTDIVQPGHIFPLKAMKGGVLVRAGHTEAGCDLAQMAGFTPASVICEILNDDGTMARLPDLIPFAQHHGLKIGTIADLIQYRTQNDCLVHENARQVIETPYGSLTCVLYTDTPTQQTHIAFIKHIDNIHHDQEVLVRVHEPLSVLDWLNLNSPHSWSMPDALKAISECSVGVLIVLNCTQSIEDLMKDFQSKPPVLNVSKRHQLRNYGIGAHILKSLGVRQMKLMANPTKMPSMSGFGLEITGFVASNDFH